MRRSRCSCGSSRRRGSSAWPTCCAAVPAARGAGRRCRRRSRSSSRKRRATPRRSSRPSGSCKGATRASRCASSAATSFPKGRASRHSRKRPRPATTRSERRSARLGTTDQARYLASLYVDDLADAWRDGIDPRFELARYGERLAASAPTFDPLEAALAAEPTLVDEALDELTRELVARHRPDVVGMSAPFPGNVYGAFRMARVVRAAAPEAKLVLGGGWVNTELRALREPRVFDYFDYVTLDDGERPLLNLLARLKRASVRRSCARTCAKATPSCSRPTRRSTTSRRTDTGTPTYDGLPLADYVSVLEMLNPMHRLWSDGRWNKITLAHGCYWKKCSFCDVSLDYIGRYDRPSTDVVLERIRALIAETGQTGFHLVDEAAPPAGMRALAKRLLDEQLEHHVVGQHPVREDVHAGALRAARAIGLRRRQRRPRGRVGPAARAHEERRDGRASRARHARVHGRRHHGARVSDVRLSRRETAQETVDALERVRQLFEAGCIQSAYWHRFSATAHSPIGLAPRALRHHADAAAEDHVRAQRRRSSTIPSAPTTTFSAPACARRSTTTCSASGLDADVRVWFEPPRSGARRSGRRRVRRAPAVSEDDGCAGSHRTLPRRVAAVLIALNKPFGVISKFSPEPGKRTLADYVPIRDVYPAGRLDTDSEGLLLLTDDGALASTHREPAPQARENVLGAGRGLADRRGDRGAARRRRPRRLRHEAGRRPAHRRAPRPLAARPADPLPREDPDGVARAHAARRQEPPGQAHDGARRLSDAAPRRGPRSATSASRAWRPANGARSTQKT